MAVGMFLLVLFGIIASLVTLAVVVPAVVTYVGQSADRNELRNSRTRERIATKALRSIANGAGNPVFEAQDALDQIDNTYSTKELN